MKSGDNHIKLKSDATDAIMIATKHPLIGPDFVAERIMFEKTSN